MNSKKLIRILKAAGECCTVGAGVATLVVSVVASLVALPVFLIFVVAAGVGLVCAAVGARNEQKKLEKESLHKAHHQEKKASLELAHQEQFLILKEDLDEIRESLALTHPSLQLHLNQHSLFTKPRFLPTETPAVKNALPTHRYC